MFTSLFPEHGHGSHADADVGFARALHRRLSLRADDPVEVGFTGDRESPAADAPRLIGGGRGRWRVGIEASPHRQAKASGLASQALDVDREELEVGRDELEWPQRLGPEPSQTPALRGCHLQSLP